MKVQRPKFTEDDFQTVFFLLDYYPVLCSWFEHLLEQEPNLTKYLEANFITGRIKEYARQSVDMWNRNSDGFQKTPAESCVYFLRGFILGYIFHFLGNHSKDCGDFVVYNEDLKPEYYDF